MSRLKKPVDKYTSEEVLKKFPEMAYSVNHSDIFEEAVYILYGRAFIIKTDLSRRMLFHCELCNKDMNSVEALKSHCSSGTHQKNKDKKDRETRGTIHWTGITNYHQDSLQYRLMLCNIKPIGLQMVEEYTRGHGPSYFKCNLCGAHGKLDHMYNHVIGKKHTDRYIKSSFRLENAILTGNERDHLRERLAREEGVDGSVIRTITGRDYYPKKWEAEGRGFVRPTSTVKVKEEPRTPSPSSPGPSRRWSSTSSSSSRRTSRRSPPLKSPRRSPWSSSRSPKRSSRSPQRSPRLQHSISRERSRETSPMSRFRNRSPPPLPPLPPPQPQPSTSAQPPIPPAVEVKDKFTQKFDLEDLMIQFNFIVKSNNMKDSEVKTVQDAEMVIDLMFRIADTLHFIAKNQLEDPKFHKDEYRMKLRKQKQNLEKVMGQIKLRMEAWIRQINNV